MDLIPAENGIKTYSVQLELSGSPYAHNMTHLRINVPNAVGDETPIYVMDDLKRRGIISGSQFAIYLNHESMMFN